MAQTHVITIVGGDTRTGHEAATYLAESVVGLPREDSKAVRQQVDALIAKCDWDGGAYGEPVYLRIPASMVEAARAASYDPQPIGCGQSTSNATARLSGLAAAERH